MLSPSCYIKNDDSTMFPPYIGISYKVVDAIPIPIVLVSMYRTGIYTNIEMPTFRISLNTGQFLVIPADTGRTCRYIKSFFFFFFF